MKITLNSRTWLVAALALASCWAGEPPKGLPETTFVVRSEDVPLLRIPGYHAINIAGWLSIEGKREPGSSSVSIAQNFKPADVVLKSSKEPVVAKLPNGQWAITFK